MPRDYQGEESSFVRKLLRFRPALWNRIEAFQRREFIKKDSEAVFRLVEKGLEAEGVPDLGAPVTPAPKEQGGKGE